LSANDQHRLKVKFLSCYYLI